MSKRLVFLHTSPVHIATFDRLLAERHNAIPVQHVVDESLLREAQAVGIITPALEQKIVGKVTEQLDGAETIVLCTCSTISGVAETAGANVVRVDRPMAAKAVSLGNIIIVVAALATTLAPTKALLLEEAAKIGKVIQIKEVLCQNAWQKFEAGDKVGYLQIIAHQLQALDGQADVVVLAQASMAEAANLVSLSVPILSSPRLGLDAALECYLAL